MAENANGQIHPTTPNYSQCYTPLCRREPVCVPVMVVPIRNWPIPAYTLLRGALCNEHRAAFSMDKFTDYMGSWYTAVCDKLRSIRKPAVNPYPDDPNFKWEEFTISPDWEPVPIEECYLQMWRLAAVLQMKGLRQKPFADMYNPEAEKNRPV